MSQVNEIFDTLKINGPMFAGSNDDQAMELARDWADWFSAGEASDWMAAGFWCPMTAHQVSELGISPGDVAARCNDLITGYDDPVYAMCNGDLSPEALSE